MPTPKYDIVVGVDFGTTASAIGYSRSSRGSPYDAPILINQSANEVTTGKIPSVLAYTQDNPDLCEDEWGFHALPQPNAISWFKLFLDDDVGTEIESWKAEAMGWATSQGIMCLPTGKSSIDTISDYLGALKVRIWDHLKEKVMKTEKSLKKTTIRFCFTVPGNWSTESREEMHSAIKRAGFGSSKLHDVCILTEADAVIVFALSTMRDHTGKSHLKTGDGVLVCDCGGGTVDMASFLISDHNPLVYHELVPSSGKLCGSTSVDREFYKLMRERFGDAFSTLPSSEIGLLSMFMYEFMRAKCTFTGYGNSIFEFPLMMSVSQSSNLECVDFIKLFQPAVNTIIKSLTRHVDEANFIKREAAATKKILVVGGFSLSPFLQREIRRVFSNTPIVVLFEHEYALTAVVRGAIGHRLQVDQKVYAEGFWTHQEGDSLIKVINIFNSGTEVPPVAVGELRPSNISTLAIDISVINLSHCEYCTESPRPYWKVNYKLSVHLGDSNGTIHFDVYWGRTRLIEWEFKPGFIRY
ncbi:actin-like ATPase domain-containing protein [Penicillium malachiteum]|nr:actin-like ATPase domain-containing protein [Penicillium malachiteum]